MAAATPIAALKVCQSSGYSDRILSGFNDMRKQSHMTDFTIRLAGGRSIPVHKIVLTVACDYFKALFDSGMKEATEGEVCFETMDKNAVCSVIDYLYGGEIEINFDEIDNYIDITETFQLPDLKHEIEKYILAKVKPSNSIRWYCYAERFGLKHLKCVVNNCLMSRFVESCNSDEFECFTLAEVVDILSDHDLKLVKGNAKLKACIHWILSNEPERKVYFKDLLKHIDLTQCSVSYLKFVIDTYADNFVNELSVYAIFIEAITVNIYPADMISDGFSFTLLGGTDKDSKLNKIVHELDLRQGNVKETGIVPDKVLKHFSARCMTPLGLFTCGGGTTTYIEDTTDECFLFDFESNQLSVLPSYPAVSCAAGVAAIGLKVYLIGGYKQHCKMQCFDLETKIWSACADLKQGVSYPLVSCIGDKIFVMVSTSTAGGSCFAKGDRITLQCYNSTSDEWSFCTSPPKNVIDTDGASAISIGNHIYIVGGNAKLCLVYNTTTQEWQDLAHPSKEHWHGSPVHLDGTIALCGGSMTDTIELYDIAANKWEISSLKLPLPLNNPFCCTTSLA